MDKLAVDIGNTHIVLGLFRSEKLIHTWRIVSDASKTVDEYGLTIRSLLSSDKVELSDSTRVVICCVVPPLARVFTKLFQKHFSVEPKLIESAKIKEIKILCDNPSEVGADRVVNAYAAREAYGAPGIVVDFGTATTFDVISKEGHYQGGVIAPGLVAASEALTNKAAMLPSIEIRDPVSVIGKNTLDSMMSGIVYGYASLVDGIVERIVEELGAGAVEITSTGGLARMMSVYSERIERVVPELTLEGLRKLS